MQSIKSFVIEERVLGNPQVLTYIPEWVYDRFLGEVKNRTVCFSLLSVEDLEDIYVVQFMDAGGFLVYHRFCELSIANGKVSDLHMGTC